MDYDKRQNTFSNEKGQSSFLRKLLGRALKEVDRMLYHQAQQASRACQKCFWSSLRSMSDAITVLEVRWQSPHVREAGRKPLPHLPLGHRRAGQ